MPTFSLYSFCIIFHIRTNWVCIVSRRQAITWSNNVSLSIGPLGMNFTGSSIKKQNFSVLKMHLKMKRRLRNGGHFVQVGDELTISVIPFFSMQYCTRPILSNMSFHFLTQGLPMLVTEPFHANLCLFVSGDLKWFIHKVITNLVVHVSFL